MNERALRDAIADVAVRLHRRHNVPLVSWADGKVVYLDPWKVPLPDDEDGIDRSLPNPYPL